MSVKLVQHTKTLKAIIIVVGGLAGLVIIWYPYPEYLSGPISLLIGVSCIVLVQFFVKRGVIKFPSKFNIPLLSGNLNLRDIGKGLICFVVAIVWGSIGALGIRNKILNDSLFSAALFFLPGAALIIAGAVFIGKALFKNPK
jgi:hypothetical protein